MPSNWAICFGYVPETSQIAEKADQTSLDSKIEDLKPGLACLEPTTNKK